MRRRSRYSDWGWPTYVPVAQRRANARREVDKLRKQGQDIQPVEIEGRTIARSFWGKGWCHHLESFGDYSNRLPRGRTYVRNGSVCHLGIEKGKVNAMVSGSELYRVNVHIEPIKKKRWAALKQRCTGKIGSLIELLQGNLSDEIMGVVTAPEHGLFPVRQEIRYVCNCPDWADMCKHISAVMYGIGARLDTQPELLFLLRGVDHTELISVDAAAEAIAGAGSRRARRRSLSGQDIENVFGVELDDSTTLPEAKPKHKTTKRKAVPKQAKTTTAKRRASRPHAKATFKPTARSIAKLRHRHGMSKAEFARAVGVSGATIAHWEKAVGPIKLQARSLAGLTKLAE